MAEIREELKNALTELKKEKKRNFDQSVDLIVNLQKFDVKRNSLNTFISLPNKIKEKKICGFFEAKNPKFDTILPVEFKKYMNNKKEIKKLIEKYDFFIAQASVMPKVATVFGRALGPTGKMPSPQMGILINADDKAIDDLLSRINTSIKVRTKEASIKLSIGKQSMDEEKLLDNAMAIYNTLVKELPRDKENIKNVEIKFTMTKPIKIAVR